MPKDACYYKVKARYKVFPSAYASGAIAKCRKVGAAKYATMADARATCAKVKKSGKPFARKIQILTVMEQRSRFGKKPQQAAYAKSCKNAIRRKHGKKT